MADAQRFDLAACVFRGSLPQLTIIAMLGIFCLGTAAGLHAGQQPNIPFFYVDDMGWQDTSVQFSPEPGERERPFRTPHMQRLAEGG